MSTCVLVMRIGTSATTMLSLLVSSWAVNGLRESSGSTWCWCTLSYGQTAFGRPAHGSGVAGAGLHGWLAVGATPGAQAKIGVPVRGSTGRPVSPRLGAPLWPLAENGGR